MPCKLANRLQPGDGPALVVATARHPKQAQGLSLTLTEDKLRIMIGDRVLHQISAPPVEPKGTACTYALQLGSGRWSIEGGPLNIKRKGELEEMPVVNGFFSELDIRSGPAPTIEVTTVPHMWIATQRQTIGRIAGFLFAASALLLVAIGRVSAPSPVGVSRIARTLRTQASTADAVVGVTLIGWWFIAPTLYDDGWIAQNQASFQDSGGFSAYYSSLGVNHAFAYWLDWTEHWLVERSNSLLVLRVPALLCLAATWALCRWILVRVLSPSTGGGRVAQWALASAFLLCSLAWGMTLRPEPQLALLVVGVLACVVRFLERQSAAPLAVAAVLAALAVSVHPVGILSLAPVLAITPTLCRWARWRLMIAAAILAAAGALVVLLLPIGSDLGQWRSDATTVSAATDRRDAWLNEPARYQHLRDPQYGTPARRGSVALMLLATSAYVLRPRRRRRVLLDLPGVTMAISLILLIAIPTKWPWHFGALIGFAALAAVSESERLRQEGALRPGWRARPLVAIAAALVAIAWSWSPRQVWNDLDLRSLDWTLGFESRVSLSDAALLVPLLLLYAVVSIALVRSDREILRSAPWRVASWTSLALAGPLIAFTILVLVADATTTPSWTLARQNVETLADRSGCGLADYAEIPRQRSMQPLASLESRTRASSRGPRMPSAPIYGLRRFALGPVGSDVGHSPWFAYRPPGEIGLFVTPIPKQIGRLEVEWGRARNGRVRSLSTRNVWTYLGPEVRRRLVGWRFLTASELPAPDREANAIRVIVRGDALSGVPTLVTAPVTYSNDRLVGRFTRANKPSLVLANVVMYFPCVHQPRLHAGIVDVPSQIVGANDSWPVGTGTSPFDGVADLYQLERLPLIDSAGPINWLVVYEIDQYIPGAIRTKPPSATTFTS